MATTNVDGQQTSPCSCPQECLSDIVKCTQHPAELSQWQRSRSYIFGSAPGAAAPQIAPHTWRGFGPQMMHDTAPALNQQRPRMERLVVPRPVAAAPPAFHVTRQPAPVQALILEDHITRYSTATAAPGMTMQAPAAATSGNCTSPVAAAP